MMAPALFDDARRQERVLVLGAGRSGLAAVELLRRGGAAISVYDRNPLSLHSLAAEIERRSGPELPDFAEFDRVIQSPGVRVPQGAHVMPEIDLAAEAMTVPLLGITGSNGKSTTSELIGAMLRAGGLHAPVAGNIGVALCSVVREPADWIVAELSSFQLEHSQRLHARVAVLLNLAPDHLDRHGSLEAYGSAKARLAVLQDSDGVLVFNEEDAWAAGVAQQSRARTVAFSLAPARHADAVFLEGADIVIREAGRERARIPQRALSTACRTPIANALAAIAAARAAGAHLDAIRTALAEFPGLPHRNTLVCVRRGVRFVNDSKATNPAAAAASLGSTPPPVWWLAGGRNKGLDFAPLVAAARAVCAAILYGEAAPELERALRGRVPTLLTATLEQAVNLAAERAREGDTVLLAPACASFDQFKSFEDRGERFASYARALPC
jgi:UDP-N-acetylmuramoylalanine--D-glutamate ligase